MKSHPNMLTKDVAAIVGYCEPYTSAEFLNVKLNLLLLNLKVLYRVRYQQRKIKKNYTM